MSKHLAVILAFLFVAPAVFCEEVIPTRFGELIINDSNTLLYKNQPIKPNIQGNNSLSLVKSFRIGNTDVCLLQDTGGSACPIMYYFVSISASGAKGTPSFGTCNDVSEIKKVSNSIIVKILGGAGPFASEIDKKKALKEKHVYIYANGVVTENGKPVE